MEKIVIQGGAVTVIEERIKDSGTLENFLSELVKIRPTTIDCIPHGCIGIKLNETDKVYYIYIPPRVADVKYDVGNQKARVLLPASVYEITIAGNSPNFTVYQALWHFVKDRPHTLKDLKIYQNIFPNVALRTNSVCFGTTVYEEVTRGCKNAQEVIGRLVSTLEGSYFVFSELMEPSKFSSSLSGAVKAYLKGNKSPQDELEQISNKLLEIEKSDWESLSDAKIKLLNKEREALIRKREKIILDSKKTEDTSNWTNHIFEFMEKWTNDNMELIESDPDTANSKLMGIINPVQAGGPSGRF